MPSTSPKFGLTLMPDNVVTPEVIVNEGISTHDILIAGTVKDYKATPPGAPADGDTYLVGASATGAWAAHDEEIAFYVGGWIFLTAPLNFVMYNENNGYYYRMGASVWGIVTILESFSGYIQTVADQDYNLKLKLPWPGTITETSTESESGTCTGTFKVNTTALGGTANSVSSTRDDKSHASANTFVAGDDIRLTVSSNSACVGLAYSVKYTRPFI